MENSLVVVTVLSLGMAASLSVVVWRMLRDERRRSNARVAALAEMAVREAGGANAAGVGFKPRIRVAALPEVRESRRQAREPRSETFDLPLNPPPPGSRLAPPASDLALPLFATPAPSAASWANRFAIMAALALLGATIVLFALASQARSAVERRVPPREAAPAGETAAAIELLALHDSRQGDTLTITGTVRNPRGGGPLNRVTVTALTFDAAGQYVATGRALIDVTALAPGDESPFVVTVPSAANVARYRIAFRGEDGRVIAHTDRRQSPPVAEGTAASLTNGVVP